MVFRKLITEQIDKLTFDNNHLGGYHGQSNYKLRLLNNGVAVAFLDYNIFEGKINIEIVESIVKNKGYATKLIDYLADKLGYENIQWGFLSSDGTIFKKKMDLKYNFDEVEYTQKPNKHLDLSVLDFTKKLPLVYDFVNDLYLHGRLAWNTHIDKIRKTNYDWLDFNELADIVEWIKNSKTNDNDPSIEPTDFIIAELEDLKKNFENL